LFLHPVVRPHPVGLAGATAGSPAQPLPSPQTAVGRCGGRVARIAGEGGKRFVCESKCDVLRTPGGSGGARFSPEQKAQSRL